MRWWLELREPTVLKVGSKCTLTRSLQRIFLTTSLGKLNLTAANRRSQGKGIVAHLCGVDDRNQAEALSGLDVCVLREQFDVLEDDEHYWYELQGLKVYSLVEEARVLLGEVSGFLETGANDVLMVKGCSHSIDQKERLIPYVDQFLLKVDTDEGEILVDWDPEF